MKNTFRLTIFILLVLTSIQYSCSANKTRLARDDWAMIDTIGIIRLNVSPDAVHRNDEQINIIEDRCTAVAWRVSKTIKANSYFQYIELNEEGVNTIPAVWPIYKNNIIVGLSISLPGKYFTYDNIIKLYRYAIKIYDELPPKKWEELHGLRFSKQVGLKY